MSDTVIKVENLSKQYRLGEMGTGTISHDLNRWWHKVRGKEDPYLKIGEVNDRTKKGSSDYVWALQDIDFSVKRGEVLGIIGKNGAGKSTLLKLLSRVTSPTTGKIKTKGRIASLLEVGTGFHNELTGRENIFLNGAIMGMTKVEIRTKLEEIIDFSGTERYIDTPVKRYSSGMRVRLGFAVAAYLEPEILIVDEVLAVGDAEFQKKAIGKMQDVSTGEGRTVLFVSHNMAAVMSLCTRGLLLKDGMVHYEGDIASTITQYLSVNRHNNNSVYNYQEETGKYEAWIESAHLEVDSVKRSVLVTGEDVSIVVHYRSFKAKLRCALFIGVYDAYGDKILHLGSLYGDFDTFDSKVSGTLRCKLPRLPLPEGKYTINLSFHVHGRPHHHIQNALGLIVEYGDFYGNGRVPDPSQTKLLIEQNWVIEE